MNKLHNFFFIGEFPMFDLPEDDEISFLQSQKSSIQILSQEIYLPPFDNSRAYYDLTDNYAGITTYNLRYIEGQELSKTANESSMLDEIDIDNIDAAEFIFLDSFDSDIQSALPDISLQDIFLDPHVMNVSDRKTEKSNTSDFLFGESEVINLYYLNENPLRERKVKYTNRNGKENKYSKRRKNI